jgi:hypothetical protein
MEQNGQNALGQKNVRQKNELKCRMPLWCGQASGHGRQPVNGGLNVKLRMKAEETAALIVRYLFCVI